MLTGIDSRTITSDLLLDLLGAVGDDHLGSPGSVARWAANVGFDAETSSALSLQLSELRRLRDALEPLLGSAATGTAAPPGSTATLNDLSASAPVVLELLDRAGTVLAVERALGSGRPGSGVPAALAREAIRLLGGPDRARIRRCPAPRCGRFFLAERASRVWCSSACGNRTRVARHHARRRADRPARDHA
jgi:predicted RNA-binding Zn ribbon-like protein